MSAERWSNNEFALRRNIATVIEAKRHDLGTGNANNLKELHLYEINIIKQEGDTIHLKLREKEYTVNIGEGKEVLCLHESAKTDEEETFSPQNDLASAT